MNKQSTKKRSLVSILVMLSFVFLLLAALVFRVYRADRDLGELRIAERQARLAAEAGTHYVVEKMRSILSHTDYSANSNILTSSFFANNLDIDVWKKYGLKTDSSFRIVGIRKLSDEDIAETPLIDESLQFQVICEGRCGGHRYSNAAVIQLYDLTASFAVFKSLDEFYYGRPIQPWIEKAKSLEAFVKQNSKLFEAGILDRMGICYDPALLYKMFVPDGQDPFNSNNASKMVGNFGSKWFKYGNSPCRGPLYCQTPIVVDSHKFFGPVQTALYLYRRGNSQPVIQRNNTLIALNSSSRLQDVANRAEGRNPLNVIVDRDSPLYSSFIPEWRPDFVFLREFAKKNGIYIDKMGRGFRAGIPISVDYHPGENYLYSDTYLTANSVAIEQDEFKDQHIILATDAKFNGFNNLSSENLGGAHIIFSERSIYLRGEIGSDLVIVTPKHIFLTGPTNVDSKLNLFLIAGNGTALSTVDLEEYINENNPDPEFVEAAREWLINALIYKPGAGVYTIQSRSYKNGPVNFRRLFNGKSLKVQIYGGCISGNLQRWIDNLEPDSFSITWNREAASRLPVKPFSANILRMRTQPEP